MSLCVVSGRDYLCFIIDCIINIMKLTRFICVALLFIMPLAAYSNDTTKIAPRPKVGVVLSGGGAKGAAHIGVLKYIEEAGIPIDYIAGTSMGAIVGGLYALGYTPDEMLEIISSVDWGKLISNKVDRKHSSYERKVESRTQVLSLAFDAKTSEADLKSTSFKNSLCGFA